MAYSINNLVKVPKLRKVVLSAKGLSEVPKFREAASSWELDSSHILPRR